MNHRLGIVASVTVCLVWSSFGATLAAEEPKPGSPKTAEAAVQKGIDYLRTKGQAEDGSFSAASSPAITAIVTTGILRNGRTAQDAVVAKALKYLENLVQSDGGIYKPNSRHRNYETAVSLMCFSEANKDGRYDKIVKNAESFLKNGQIDESMDVPPTALPYGGAGYGRNERPDLSNTSFLIDALKSAGVGSDDEAMKKALVFVSRCQNLESEYNTTEFPAKNPDGGFYYTPATGGVSQAGNLEDGGLRSYGSMTYAGLKSMIYCGVDSKDPRAVAAIEWIRKNYTLDANPGMGASGQYYYYQTFAKALAAMKLDTITDSSGVKHDWRADLIAELLKRQKDDGYWVNDKSDRWLEGDPNLVTGYALLALSYCRK